jgi:hypothetical protein
MKLVNSAHPLAHPLLAMGNDGVDGMDATPGVRCTGGSERTRKTFSARFLNRVPRFESWRGRIHERRSGGTSPSQRFSPTLAIVATNDGRAS